MGGLAPPLEFGPQALVFASAPSWKVTVDPLGSSLAMLSFVELKPSSSASPASTLQSLSPSSEAAITRSGTLRVSPSLILTSSNCVAAGELSRRLVTVSAKAADANASVKARDIAKTLRSPASDARTVSTLTARKPSAAFDTPASLRTFFP